MLVGERHEEHAADARLQVLGRQAAPSRAGASSNGQPQVLDRELAEADAEALGDELRVAARVLAVVARRHGDRLDRSGAERVGGERRDERRVDAAREPEQHALEAVLAHVVAAAPGRSAPQSSSLHRRRPLGAGRRLEQDPFGGAGGQVDGTGSMRAPAPASAAQARVAQALGHGEAVARCRRPAAPRRTTRARARTLAVGAEHERCARRRRARPGRRRGCRRPRSRCRRARGSQHLLARLALAEVVGRGRDVEHAGRAAQRELASATASGSQMSSQIVSASAARRALDGQRAAPGRERALLVEDAVVGQLALVVARHDLPAGAQGHALRTRSPSSHGQPTRSGTVDLGRQRLGLAPAGAQEARPQQQILGRVAGDRELGRQHEVGPRARGVGTRVGDALPVLGKRSDREVELGQREADHARRWYSPPMVRRAPARVGQGKQPPGS